MEVLHDLFAIIQKKENGYIFVLTHIGIINYYKNIN